MHAMHASTVQNSCSISLTDTIFALVLEFEELAKSTYTPCKHSLPLTHQALNMHNKIKIKMAKIASLECEQS